jgi:rare lipoprotein A
MNIMNKKNIYFIKIFLLGLVLIIFSACTSVVRFNNNSTTNNKNITEETTSKSNDFGALRGLASYYADKFEGKQTASGEIFSQQKFTAAHKTLPFGTMVKVTRVSNQKQVIVKINDRGPFVKGRIIDLSLVAAKELDLINAGVAEVIIEVIK